MDIGLPVEVVEVELTEVDAPPTEQPTETPEEAPAEIETPVLA
jgi:hypothetical protein